MPGMLHMKLVRSTVPHARILDIDTSRALAAEGVRAVLTGDQFPISFGILPVSQDEHALCRDKVRFVGDPVAAVVAVEELAAEEAARLVEVRYEPLATIGSPEEALAVPEPRIHDYGDSGNIHKAVALDFGDVPAALAGAALVVEDLLLLPGQHPPGPRAARGAGLPRHRRAASPSCPAPRRRTTCTAPRPACSTCRRRASASSRRPRAAASAARPIRSTTRSSRPRPRWSPAGR